MSARWKGKSEGSWQGGYEKSGGKSDGKGKSGGGGGRGPGKGGGRGPGGGGQKPTDDPNFVRYSTGMKFEGSSTGTAYVVDAYVASGTFSRVFRVHAETGAAGATEEAAAAGGKRRWGAGADAARSAPSAGAVYAAKVMRRQDSYNQYSSDGAKEGELLQRLDKAQRDAGREVLTMNCIDSFATKDAAGEEYWCLILEWLDASLFDAVRANGGAGLHLSMVRALLTQLLEQLRVLQELQCTHTDIKHKNCCLADTEHYMAPPGAPSARPTLVFTRPSAKFIDYGNAVFEGEEKVHPIHTKQFRAPEVLLNVSEGWGPPSDTWTLGITAVYLVTGQLIFNSHDPNELVGYMAEALGPFPERLLSRARDGRMRRSAESASQQAPRQPLLGQRTGLAGAKAGSPEARCLDLLGRMLALDPAERISPADALQHPFVTEDLPPPPRPSGAELRTFDSSGGGKGPGKGRKGK